MDFYKYVIPSAIVATVAIPKAASAHFIWATIDNGQVRFALLESPSEKPDAKFAKYVENVKAFSGKKALTLEAPKEGARYATLSADQKVATGDVTVGVMAREGEPFLLVYHAKAAVSEEAASTDSKSEMEIIARRDGKQLVLEVRRDGWPVPESEVNVYWPGVEDDPTAIKTDGSGRATVPLPASLKTGRIGVRALAVDSKAGEADGNKHSAIKHYATLTYPIEGAKADPVAWSLLKNASENRLTWDPTITGVSADITVNWNGKSYSGTASFANGKGVDMQLTGADKDVSDWTKTELTSLFGHRRGGRFDQGDGRHPITFAATDETALGRRLEMHDTMNSFYRVKNSEIQEVDRTMGDTRLVITILDSVKPDGKKYLPKDFIVTYLDAKTNAITRTEMFSDTFQPIDGNWVPATRRIVTAKDGNFLTRIVTISNVKLQKGS